jgi:hypothetical protein
MAKIYALPPIEKTEAEKHMEKRIADFMQYVVTINRLGRQIGRTQLSSDIMMALNSLVMMADNPDFQKLLNIREAAKK